LCNELYLKKKYWTIFKGTQPVGLTRTVRADEIGKLVEEAVQRISAKSVSRLSLQPAVSFGTTYKNFSGGIYEDDFLQNTDCLDMA